MVEAPVGSWKATSALAFNVLACGQMDEGCASTCTPDRIRRAAVLLTRAAAEGYLCALIFFILVDVLFCSIGGRRLIISQMGTSDLL